MVDRIPGQWRKLPAQFDSRKLTLQPRQPRAYPDYITHTPSRATLHPISALGVTRRVFYFGTRVSGNFMPVSVRQRTLRSFFTMPPGTKSAPPQQSNLHEMWKKGSSSGKQQTLSTKPDTVLQGSSKGQSMEIDSRQAATGLTHHDPPKLQSTSPKGKGKGVEREIGSRGKRRRIVESPSSEGASGAFIGAEITDPKPSPLLKRQRTDPPEPGALESTQNSKVWRKNGRLAAQKATVAPKASDDAEQEVGASAAESEAEKYEENEEEEEGVMGDEVDIMLSDTEGATVSKAAMKNATQIIDVDVNGGWKVGQPVPYSALAHVFGLVEATTKRLEITSILTSFLLLVMKRSKKDDHTSLLQTVYLCINKLCPDYRGVELGIGESLLMKAIAESTGRKMDAIKADLKEVGDLGLVAKNSKNSQRTLFKPKPLTIPFVFSQLTEIAKTAGNASQNKKISVITKLLAACAATTDEAKYIIRSLEGKLRIGLAERTLIVSLGHAITLRDHEESNSRGSNDSLALRLEEAAQTLKDVYSELPSYDHVVPVLLKTGIEGLKEKCKLSPGIPLKPMLAKPTKAIGEVLDRFEGKKFTCEYKYDGERAQVHRLEDGTIHIFSRNSEDMSAKYPDIFDQLPKAIKGITTSFVLDSEAVAFDRTTLKLLPFQELSRRKRKDVKVEDIKVWVCLFGFDLLYLNGEPLLHKTLSERREILRQHFHEVPGEFMYAKSSDSETTEEIQAFLEESVNDGCEGLMVKMLETDASYYEPSRRSINWLKLKKDYLQGVGDSFDLVVVGGYHGKGKRTAVYGAFLLAIYDPESESFQTICKIGTGFSEEALKMHTEALKGLEIVKCRSDVDVGGAKPDVWFEPKMVWEVLAADLSLSPIYSAAKGSVDSRGISLRFPRFIRVRDDKNPDDATNPEQVAEMYERQSLATKGSNKGVAGDDFW